MKKNLLSVLLALALTLGLAAPVYAASVSDFSDVKSTDWYYGAVSYAVEQGLFTGTSATTFAPNGSMTRAMFVTVLGRLEGIDITLPLYTTSVYTDVESSAWYAPYVKWAYQSNIVTGTGGGNFSPDLTITREQMATILYRYAAFKEIDLTASADKYNAFSDIANVSSYAQTAMVWATSKGIINGSGNMLNPLGTATRAEVATVFMNATSIFSGSSTEITVPDNNNGSENNTSEDEVIDFIGDEYGQQPLNFSATDSNGGFYDYTLSNAVFDAVNDMRVENGLEPLYYSLRLQEIADIRSEEFYQLDAAGQPLKHVRPDGSTIYTVSVVLSAENFVLGAHEELFNAIADSGLRTQDIDASTFMYTYKKTISTGYGHAIQEEITEPYITAVSLQAEGYAQRWYDSEGHRVTMLNRGYLSAAVSVYHCNGYTYIVQVFSNSTPWSINNTIE